MLDEGNKEWFACPWRLYLYQADAVHGERTTEGDRGIRAGSHSEEMGNLRLTTRGSVTP